MNRIHHLQTKHFLDTSIKQFQYYKSLGDRTLDRLIEKDIHWQFNEESNSIAIIVKHLCGNMLSRWTNFLTEDGEKEWRNREAEFDNDIKDMTELRNKWEAGWQCVFQALENIHPQNFEQLVYIRNEGHTLTEAISRQLCHYAYHIGQLVFLGKMIKNNEWQSLSIPKGASEKYNKQKFSNAKKEKHFTDEE